MSEEKKFDTIRTFFPSTSDVEAAYKAIKAKGVKPNSEIMPYPPGGRFSTSMILRATSGTFYNHRSLQVPELINSVNLFPLRN